jgi:hypothetical protein
VEHEDPRAAVLALGSAGDSQPVGQRQRRPAARQQLQGIGPEERQVGGANPKETLVIGNLNAPDRAFIAKGPRKWPRECVTEAMLSTIENATTSIFCMALILWLPLSVVNMLS